MIRFVRGDFEIVLSRHAIKRAIGRQIPWDLIRTTIFEGKFERRGGEFIWLKKKFEQGTVVCKARCVSSTEALVVTIEWRR